MIDLSFLLNCIDMQILTCCLIIGYLIKNSTPIKNKYIPSIVTVLGLLISICVSIPNITLEVIVCGMVSGILSTGLHQTFKSFLNSNKKSK